MDTPNDHTMEWARTAVHRLLKRLAERAAQEYERQASELLLVADRVRRSWR